MSKRPSNVDEYIASEPKQHQAILKQMRAIIKSAAPTAIEKISYGMPYYGYKGRLAYFRLSTHHLGLYITPPIVNKFKKELVNYNANNATIRFPLNKPLPASLIKKLIKARIKLNKKKR
jgi:uncharacterized protein YdhG (YjbR/CyaY superfamily)